MTATLLASDAVQRFNPPVQGGAMIIGKPHRGRYDYGRRIFVRVLIGKPHVWGCDERTQRVFVQRIVTPHHEKANEEIRRKYRSGRDVFPSPSWQGESRPTGYDTVALENITPWFSEGEYKALIELGLPPRLLILRTSIILPIQMSEYDHNLINEEIEREEKQDRTRRILEVLTRSRRSITEQNALFEIIVDGRPSRDVAEAYGLRKRSLDVAASKVRAKMYAVDPANVLDGTEEALSESQDEADGGP